MIGLGGADLGEQGQCLPPVGEGGVRSLGVERMTKDQQGVGLAEAVAGGALDRQGPPGELAGSIELALIKLEAGQGGQRLAFEEPIAAPAAAGEGQGLPGAAVRQIRLAEVLVGGCQAEQGDDLRVAALGARASSRACR